MRGGKFHNALFYPKMSIALTASRPKIPWHIHDKQYRKKHKKRHTDDKSEPPRNVVGRAAPVHFAPRKQKNITYKRRNQKYFFHSSILDWLHIPYFLQCGHFKNAELFAMLEKYVFFRFSCTNLCLQCGQTKVFPFIFLLLHSSIIAKNNIKAIAPITNVPILPS